MRFLILFIFLTTNVFANDVSEIKNIVIHKDPKVYDNVIFLDKNDKKINIKEFNGNLLLLNFWATWCAPCREEIPELNEFSHKNKTIQTIAIAIDDLESVNKFTKKIPIEYLSFIAENEGVQLSQSLGNERGVLPFSVIINPKKKIEKVFYGRLKLNQLNQALNSITH